MEVGKERRRKKIIEKRKKRELKSSTSKRPGKRVASLKPTQRLHSFLHINAAVKRLQSLLPLAHRQDGAKIVS
jgi:hypothetical protein